MAQEKTSILLSDVSVEGNVVEKDKIILDAKIIVDIKAEEIITHSKSNVIGNIKSKIASLGGKLKGNVNSDQITVKKTANIEGDLIEKDKIIIDAKINGNVKTEEIETHQKSNIQGNINANIAAIGGQMKGNIISNQIKIKKTANIEGVLNQKTLEIEEGKYHLFDKETKKRLN